MHFVDIPTNGVTLLYKLDIWTIGSGLGTGVHSIMGVHQWDWNVNSSKMADIPVQNLVHQEVPNAVRDIAGATQILLKLFGGGRKNGIIVAL